jgi:Carboxypeptidase regulatory-like domain
MRIVLLIICLAAVPAAVASVFGSVRGIIHDPQHRPVQNGMVMIKSKSSDWSATVNSDPGGNFNFNAVPLGEYVVSVAAVGFEQSEQSVVVISGTEPLLHF